MAHTPGLTPRGPAPTGCVPDTLHTLSPILPPAPKKEGIICVC